MHGESQFVDSLDLVFRIFDVFVFPRDSECWFGAWLVVGVFMVEVGVPNPMVSLVQVLLHGLELRICEDGSHKKNSTSIHVLNYFKSLYIC